MQQPFGNYERGTIGHVLNALVDWGIPLTTVENIQFSMEGNLNLRNTCIGCYKYVDGFELPLFFFFFSTAQANLSSLRIYTGGPDGCQATVVPQFFAGYPAIHFEAKEAPAIRDYLYKTYGENKSEDVEFVEFRLSEVYLKFTGRNPKETFDKVKAEIEKIKINY